MINVVHFFGILNLGGAETFIMNLYRNINNDIKFDFVVHGENIGFFEQEILERGGRIHKLPKYKAYNKLIYKKKIRKILSMYNPKCTIIHTHIMSTASIILKEAKKMGFKTIAHSHTSQYQNKNFIEKKYRIKLLNDIPKHSDVNIACSFQAGNFLFKNYKFEVLDNGIDIALFNFDKNIRSELRKKLDFEKKYVIGHVGRFDEIKNQEFLVEVFTNFLKENSRSRLILIGEGTKKKDIENLVKKRGISNKVIFTGAITNVNQYMSAMDLLIFPSLFEGFPVVLVEAQASGLPVIASNTITKDVKLTDRLYFMDLNDPIDKWVDLIKKIELDIDRTSQFNMEKLYDFDSKKVAQDYTNIILEMSENND